MPLIKIESLDKDVRMALWKMTEEPSQLSKPVGVDFSDIHSTVRLKERLVTYSMLRALTSRNDLVISHLPNDKPFLDGYSLSISHTKGWAALLISEKYLRLGIDIEYFSTRVNKVADRFIRPDEQSDNLQYRLINWSAKESVYKALSEEDLMYFDMRLEHFDAADNGEIFVDDLKESKKLPVNYVINSDYVLTWTITK